MSDLIIEVEEVRGRCPVFKKGDRMVFRGGYNLDLEETDALCSPNLLQLVALLPADNGIYSLEVSSYSRGRGCLREYSSVLKP